MFDNLHVLKFDTCIDLFDFKGKIIGLFIELLYFLSEYSIACSLGIRLFYYF